MGNGGDVNRGCYRYTNHVYIAEPICKTVEPLRPGSEMLFGVKMILG